MDYIKDAFQKVKQDIDSLKEEFSFLKQNMENTSKDLVDLKEITFNLSNELQEVKSKLTSTYLPSNPTLEREIPTNNTPFNAQKAGLPG